MFAAYPEDPVQMSQSSVFYVCFFFQWKHGVPVEVIPMAYSPIMLAMQELGLTPVLRMAKEKAVSPYIHDKMLQQVHVKVHES